MSEYIMARSADAVGQPSLPVLALSGWQIGTSGLPPWQGYAVAMNDDPIGTKPEPRTKPGSIISLADRDQERRHAAARRLADRHNASLRPQAPESAA